MSSENRETFFRPPVHMSDVWTAPATLYKLCRRLLRDSGGDCVFVPIRSMQFMAVIDDDEIIFVDSQDYMVHRGVGGRVILLAWCFAPAGSLESLCEPVPCTVLHYRSRLSDVQRRLVGEFTKALELYEHRRLDRPAPGLARILAFEKE